MSVAAELAPWFAIGKDFTLACAGAFGAWVAYKGVDAWKRETVGRAHFEAARELLMAAYLTREAILEARSPVAVMPSEPHDAETQARHWAGEFDRRWKPIQDAGRSLAAAAVAGEALFGADAVEPVRALRSQAMALRASMELYVEATRERWPNDDSLRRIRADVSGSDDSPIAVKVTVAVAALEAGLTGHLRRNR